MSDSPLKTAGDSLSASHPERCRICALPLPATGSDDGICSRRCAGRRKESAAIEDDRAAIAVRILAEIANLRSGTTICPGELSRRILPGIDQPLALLRPLIFQLAETGKFRLSQKGVITRWWKIRGPFRVGPG